MLRDLPLSLIAEITGGRCSADEDIICTSVSTDTRTLKPGSLYVPLSGERFNGHAFAAQALAAGAVAMLAEEDVETVLPTVRVTSTLTALADLAAWHRDQFSGPVVAVTGSAGKTSVKQLTAHLLSMSFNTWMTQGNLNNHIGAPLTLLALQPQHQAAMIELGASGQGEIAYTARLVRPLVGIITNVAEAHLEGFGSVETICATKGELIDFIADEGTAVLNADDVFFPQWVSRAGTRQVQSFGFSEQADYRAADIECGMLDSRFTLQAEGQSFPVSLPLPGQHNIRNALAAVAAVRAVGMDWDLIIAGLASAEPVKGRLQKNTGRKGQVILDDSYNANPGSFRAAIDVLAQAGHSWLVMGDMAELGTDEVRLTAEIGAYAKAKQIDVLAATGRLSKAAAEAFGDGAHWFENKQQLAEFLNTNTGRGDTLLVKGSRSAGMEAVVNTLCSLEGEN
tara:strand:+ start:1317 stop:2675 length:1359 start_codon:yes stop_codon:yes gene_type:complete